MMNPAMTSVDFNYWHDINEEITTHPLYRVDWRDGDDMTPEEEATYDAYCEQVAAHCLALADTLGLTIRTEDGCFDVIKDGVVNLANINDAIHLWNELYPA